MSPEASTNAFEFGAITLVCVSCVTGENLGLESNHSTVNKYSVAVISYCIALKKKRLCQIKAKY